MPPPAPKPATASRILVTAGPTEEPIDEVRYLGNRSSGRLGTAIAVAFGNLGHEVTLLLGPVRAPEPSEPGIRTIRFRTAADLEALLRTALPAADLVVMAAAVADYRPKEMTAGKLRRDAAGLVLALDPVPDLLVATAGFRKPGSRVFGFALEPRERLERSALEKLGRKDLAGIVANPLETMDASDIEGTLFLRDGSVRSPGSRLDKAAFARWLANELLRA